MEFEEINIDAIKPAPYNPNMMRNKEQMKLKKGLTKFGLVDPIIIDLKHNNTIIGGHQRFEVLINELNVDTLKLLKMGDIGFVFNETDFHLKDLNDQKALNLALNKISGEWDYKLLDDLLLELEEKHYDLDLTGFDGDDIIMDVENSSVDEIIQDIEKGFEFRDEEKENYEPIKKTTKLRQIYKLELIFDSEEEMSEKFDILVKEGYNVRMSDV